MNHRHKKRFGQNFLQNRHVIEQILDAAELTQNDHVLEIGPGLGALTDDLLRRAGNVSVMEVDRDLAQKLIEREEPSLQVHQGDALKMSWGSLLDAPPYKLVANLPYNISSQIVFKILDHRALFSRLVLMFQKEVGDRLCAGPGTKDYGILSVLAQLWFDIRRVVVVPPGAFFPPPKVHSAVLLFEPLKSPRVAVSDEAFFRRVVKAAFAQRRKTLRNTLKSLGLDKDALESALVDSGVDPGRRAETLSLEEFGRMSEALWVIESS